MRTTPENIRGFLLYKKYLPWEKQLGLVNQIRAVVREAPMVSLSTPTGKKLSVQMTSAGACGWFSDRKGYRYETSQISGKPWPKIPAPVLDIWNSLVSKVRKPDTCLINFYDSKAKMGLHQDKDERDFSWPVLSISLGDDALFRIGNTFRGGKTESFWLHSGDVLIMGDSARLCYHGVDRIKFGSSNLLKQSGRINLTLRVVY